MIREKAFTSQELADLHRGRAANIRTLGDSVALWNRAGATCQNKD